MARDATARLYDVDEDTLVFRKFDRTEKYDQGEIEFQAKPGMLIDIHKLQESIQATRLGDSTRSGVLKLEVTAVGKVVADGDSLTFRIEGSNKQFSLVRDSGDDESLVWDRMLETLKRGEQVVSVSGWIDGWSGRWPAVLQKLMKLPEDQPRKMMVTSFETTGPAAN